MFAAILDPLNRPQQKPGRKWDQKVLRIVVAAHAEAAANVILDHRDRVFRKPQVNGEYLARSERRLGSTVDNHTTCRCVPFCQKAACFHRNCCVTVHTKSLATHVGCVLASSIDIPKRCSKRARYVCPGLFE